MKDLLKTLIKWPNLLKLAIGILIVGLIFACGAYAAGIALSLENKAGVAAMMFIGVAVMGYATLLGVGNVWLNLLNWRRGLEVDRVTRMMDDMRKKMSTPEAQRALFYKIHRGLLPEATDEECEAAYRNARPIDMNLSERS